MERPIEASELIITPRGTIYHLDLAPEQLADTVITVGDPNRVAEVSRYFDRLEHKAEHREFISHTGYIGNTRITVVGTGIGPDNIDIVINELDALANIDFDSRLPRAAPKKLSIIRMGTCGSPHEDIPVDSLVISTHGLGLDNLLHFYRQEPDPVSESIAQAFTAVAGLAGARITPYITPGSRKLLSQFGEGYFRGITLTCPGFYGPQGRVLRAPVAHEGIMSALSGFHHEGHRITGVEMETSAIYGLGRMLGHECLSINTVVANRASGTFTTDVAKGVDHMVRKSLEVIVRK